MEKNVSRILIETVVKKALKSIKDSPERGIRNLIDVALQFSDGRFQKDFFASAQTMLQNENSAYYGLVRDIITHVDIENLYTFGMNVGYDGCTIGARRIRENEKVLCCKIPWAMSIQMGVQQVEKKQREFNDLISKCEKLGVHTWMLFASDQPEKAFLLIAKHPDSAFCIFCEITDVTSSFLEGAITLKNMMTMVRYDEHADDVCAELRRHKLLYSVWYQYERKDVKKIINGGLFNDTQQLSPVFTVLLPDEQCPEEVRQLVYSAVKQVRSDQRYRTIAWDLKGDHRLINTMLSEDARPEYFELDGDLRDGHKKLLFLC